MIERLPQFEAVGMAISTLRAHKLRSMLTVLGVIIGVMTVIVIASILTGMRQNIVSLVQEYGTDNIYAFHLSTGPRLGPRDRREWARKPLTLDDVDALRSQASAVAEVGYTGFAWNVNRTLRHRGESYTRANIQGVSANLVDVSNIPVAEGRFLTDADGLRRADVCVIGIRVAEALFPHEERIAGREIRMLGSRFLVVGVLGQRQSTFFGSNEEDNAVFIPYRTLRKYAPRSEYLMISVRARPGELARAWDQVEGILRNQRGLRFDQENDFDLTTADRLVEQFDSMTAAIGLIAIAISGIGLLVGGIGVMNIMLMSVTERTREIGVRKAVGARRRDITLQFLIEAITLTSVGGILGILLAMAAGLVVMWFLPQLPAATPLWAVVTGFLVSVAVGLLFGVWPAVKASRLDPIECLRYE